jgi:predicted component of type VI protein secretion system
VLVDIVSHSGMMIASSKSVHLQPVHSINPSCKEVETHIDSIMTAFQHR